ncbi:MAG: type VII toxin-antitoxin system HepT family RNase toxin [Tumebacillaceae bacterium]
MFITDQHRTQIRGYLSEMEKQFDVLTALKPHSLEDFQTQPILRAAGERALHLVLECLTDIGNIIIDALIMRDPASYEDIFEILTEEGVFEKAFYAHFISAVRFRKTLVHDYLQLQVEDVWNAVQAYAGDFATLRDSIANYVKL